jgi:hypothetical protein
MDWEYILSKLEILMKRFHRILYRDKNGSEQAEKIEKKIKELIPTRIIIEDRTLIKKIINLSISIYEGTFKVIVDQLGLDLLNSIMYLHGIIQSNQVNVSIHNVIDEIDKAKFQEFEGKDYRHFSGYLLDLEYTLRSAMEYLLKKHRDQIVHFKPKVRNPVNKILLFIDDFHRYKFRVELLSWLDFPYLKKVKLIFGPGYYFYFFLAHDRSEYYDYSKKLFDIYLNWDLSKDNLFDFNEIINQFSSVSDIWREEFGYKLENLVKTAHLFITIYRDKFDKFFTHLIEFPILKIENINSKTIEDLENEVDLFLARLIRHYFKHARNKNSLINYKELKTRYLSKLTNDENEISKIINELCVDNKALYISHWNRLAYSFIYPIDEEIAFIYPNNTYSALIEKLYMNLGKINDPKTEFVLIKHIKRILKKKGYNIHPLSGKFIINENKLTIGQIDIVAYKSETLLLIESKTIPQKKTSVKFLKDYYYILKAISKKLSRFDKSIGYFEKYCHDSTSFLKYDDIPLDINEFTSIRYFFVSPDLIYNPPPFKRNRDINVILPILLERMI